MSLSEDQLANRLIFFSDWKGCDFGNCSFEDASPGSDCEYGNKRPTCDMRQEGKSDDLVE